MNFEIIGDALKACRELDIKPLFPALQAMFNACDGLPEERVVEVLTSRFGIDRRTLALPQKHESIQSARTRLCVSAFLDTSKDSDLQTKLCEYVKREFAGLPAPPFSVRQSQAIRMQAPDKDTAKQALARRRGWRPCMMACSPFGGFCDKPTSRRPVELHEARIEGRAPVVLIQTTDGSIYSVVDQKSTWIGRLDVPCEHLLFVFNEEPLLVGVTHCGTATLFNLKTLTTLETVAVDARSGVTKACLTPDSLIIGGEDWSASLGVSVRGFCDAGSSDYVLSPICWDPYGVYSERNTLFEGHVIAACGNVFDFIVIEDDGTITTVHECLASRRKLPKLPRVMDIVSCTVLKKE
jgi:hypothetical protein